MRKAQAIFAAQEISAREQCTAYAYEDMIYRDGNVEYDAVTSDLFMGKDDSIIAIFDNGEREDIDL